MAEASITNIGKPWELVQEFDDLQLQNETMVSQGTTVEFKAHDPNTTLPGMTAEYREFCSSFSTGIIPIEDLYELVYKPLKNRHPERFQGKSQEVEFYSVYTLNGKKMYKKLSGKERDVAVQKDIFEQATRRKVMEIYIQSLRFKLQTKRQDLSLIKSSCDPAKIFIFENSMKSIERAFDRGDMCDKTLKQLDRFIEFTWILFFEKDMAKKRKNVEFNNLDYGCMNKCSQTNQVTTVHSSKRMKGNPKEAETKLSARDRGSISSSSSIDDCATEASDWIVDSSDGYSRNE